MRGQKLSTLNVGNLLVILGLGALAASFWLPYGTADRVHRIETRASVFAAKMFEVISARQEAPWQDTAAAQAFAAEVNEQLDLKDPTGSLYLESRLAPDRLRGTAWWLEGKHYLYMVTSTPGGHLELDDQEIDRPGAKDKPPGADHPPARDLSTTQKQATPKTRSRAIEVYAWPKDEVKGATTVFYYRTSSGGAFQRNLSKRYLGPAAFPEPGDGYPHHPTTDANIYYGYDDERWQFIAQ